MLDDLRLTDLGVSAFTGAHRDRGALKTLLTKIEDGSIESGAYLLIEAMDRLTREVLTESVPLFIGLANAGLVIVTLNDEKEWTRDGLNKDMADFMYSIMLLSRGHEESRRKGEMVQSAFRKGREKHSRREFGSAPGWLKRQSKDAPWEVVTERAESVRRVFELAAQGYGSKAIARRANEEGWPIPTRETSQKPGIWHVGMPGRLLRMVEVTGAHEYRLMSHDAKQKAKHWRGLASGIVVPDYYPRIIEDDLWHRARASIEGRRVDNRRRDENYFNIWSGLMRCGHCGASIQRKTELRGWSRAQLLCSNKIAGVTTCKTGAASKTDAPLLRDICAVGGALMGLGYDKEQAQRAIQVATSRLRDFGRQAKNIADAIAVIGPTSELIAKAASIKAECDALEAQIAAQRHKLAVEPNSLLDTAYADQMLEILYAKTPEAIELRADCNTRLSRAIERIWFFAYDVAIVKFHGTMTLLHVPLEAKTKGGVHPKLTEFATIAAEGGLLPLPGLAELVANDVTAREGAERSVNG